MVSKFSDRHLGEGLRPVHAGVVEEHVVGVAVRDEPREAVEIGDVASLRIGRAAAGADRRGAGLDLLGGARHERHMRAGVGERRRRGKPDAAPSPGHERTPAVEAERGGGGKGHAGLRAWPPLSRREERGGVSERHRGRSATSRRLSNSSNHKQAMRCLGSRLLWRRTLPLPPCGGGRTRPKAERGGGAGHRALRRSWSAAHQPQGQGPGDPSGPRPAAARVGLFVGNALHARRPPPARPSAESASPTRGEGRRGVTPPPSHRGCSGRRTSARGCSPARRGPRSPRACTGASRPRRCGPRRRR